MGFPQGGGSGIVQVKSTAPAADVTRTGNTFGSLSTPWTVTLSGVAVAHGVLIVGSVAARCNANEQFAFRLRRTSGMSEVLFTTQVPNVAAANVMFQAPLYVLDTNHGGGAVTYEIEVATTSALGVVTVTVGPSTPNPYTYPTNSDGASALLAQEVVLL